MAINKKYLILGIFALISVIFFLPILHNVTYWGGRDWGFHLYMNEVAKSSIFTYGQVPYWDAFRCGGNVFLGHPESPFLSIHFILVSLMDTIVAIKLNIILYAIIGLYGMFLLSNYFNLGKYSSFLPPILYVFNSSLMLYLAEGNYWYRAVIWLPYVAYFFLKSNDSKKYVIPAAAAMLMMFFDTNSYVFGVTLFFLGAYAIIDSIINKRYSMIISAVLIVILVGLFGMIKFMPMLEFTKNSPVVRADAESGYTVESFLTGLFNRDQEPYSHWFANNNRPFFQYGMYIGIFAVLLALAGILMYWRKYLAMTVTLIISTLVMFGQYSIINLYTFIKDIPLFDYFHEATRFNVIFLMIISIFAGLALSKIEKTEEIIFGNSKINIAKWKNLLVAAVVIFIFINLILVNQPVLKKIFIAPPIQASEKGQFFETMSPYGSNPWTDGVVTSDLYNNVWGHGMYLNLLENKGTFNGNCHGALSNVNDPTSTVVVQPKYFINGTANPAYKGEAYLQNGDSTANISVFTPNKMTVEYESKQDDTLILNQNYYSSWKSKEGNVKNVNGLVGIDVKAGKGVIEFYQFQMSFIIGLIVSLISIIAAILAYVKFDALKAKYSWL